MLVKASPKLIPAKPKQTKEYENIDMLYLISQASLWPGNVCKPRTRRLSGRDG